MPSPSLSEHCTPISPFLTSISSTFHTCIPTPLALLSTVLGILSIVSWLFAQLPQVLKNYSLKSASGLSVYFLAEWLLGDLTNLVGALLTGQATWQVVVALYYVTVDVCLVTQYFWYSRYKPWREKRLEDNGEDFDTDDSSPPREVLIGVSPTEGTSTPGSTEEVDKKNGSVDAKQSPQPIKARDSRTERNKVIVVDEKHTAGISSQALHGSMRLQNFGVNSKDLMVASVVFAALAKASPVQRDMNRHILVTHAEDSIEVTGRVLSWISTVLYLGSRLPQIYKNHRRRSTSGLSPSLFIAAFFGNLFYSSSLLANPLAWNSYPPYGLDGWVGPEGSDRGTWVSLAIPFFLGAAGVLAMDAIVGIQFLIFGEGDDGHKVAIVRDERGRSHWRKVSGWMRGWVPSPSPPPMDDDEDDERPLLERANDADRRYGGA